MRFSLVKLVPRNIFHARIFDDVILAFYFALRRLGHEVEFINNRLNPESLNLIFGAHMHPEWEWLRKKGPERVIVNLEQFRLESDNWAEDAAYLDLMREHRVWDYSESNVRFLKSRGINVNFFTLGYVPDMTRLAENEEESGEVLFYGGINKRRFKIIDALTQAGVRVRCLENEYGQARDRAIFEAALILNIHRGGAANLEMARLAYLLANRKAVASECNADTEIYSGLADACAFFPYDALAEGVIKLMADKKARREQAGRGFEVFRRLSLVDSLETLVGRGSGAASPVCLAMTTEMGSPIYSISPVPQWLTPVDDLNRPERPEARPPLWRLYLKKLRYHLILCTAKGLRRFNYQRKLDNLKKEIKRER